LYFVMIYETLAGNERWDGASLRCQRLGSAEHWLNGLVKRGKYRKWEHEVTEAGLQAEYCSARVFRVFPVEIDESRPGEYESGSLVAIWDTTGGRGHAAAART